MRKGKRREAAIMFANGIYAQSIITICYFHVQMRRFCNKPTRKHCTWKNIDAHM